ncbi:MAG TPA: LUD domain-containing protein [Chloroflexota bacterium]|jgi:L-lactate dehydrogenase complex protein LldG|nr:LUD domain-containing protein [Chloroflexota bacterium]
MVAAAPSGQQLWSVFTAKAELVGAAVMRAATQASAVALLREAGADVRRTASVSARFADIAEALGAPVQRDIQTAEVVAPAQLAVAETGSVLLDEPDVDRAACFLAERLWVLVGAEQIVPTLEQALERVLALIQAGAHHPQLVTGPSRTADIERVLTIGVHGPRALVVLVIGEIAE